MNVYRYYQKIEGRSTFFLWPRNAPAIRTPDSGEKECGFGVIESAMEDGEVCIPVLGEAKP